MLRDRIGKNTIVMGDRDYDADRIRTSLRDRGALANISPKHNCRCKPYSSIKH